MRIKLLAIFALLAGSALTSMNASAITTGTYNLHNHPNGNAAEPYYGLRLDGLLSVPSIYTFDFDHALSSMQLTWDGTKIVIDGSAFGGEDSGAQVMLPEPLQSGISISNIPCRSVISQPADGGLDDLKVNANNANFGTISGTVGLTDYAI